MPVADRPEGHVLSCSRVLRCEPFQSVSPLREVLFAAACRGVQDPPLQAEGAPVVHELARSNGRQFRAELGRPDELPRRGAVSILRLGRRVDVQLVPEEPRHGGVRTRVVRLIEEEREQGQGSDDRGAQRAGPLPQRCQVRVVSRTPGTLRPQRIEGQEDAPLVRLRLDGLPRRGNDQCLPGPAAALQPCAVVAERHLSRQADATNDVALVIHLRLAP